MRYLFLLAVMAVLVPGLTRANPPTISSAVTAIAHTGGSGTAANGTTAAPAKSAPAIIPGSPLAALTGATPPPQQETETPTPFGTDEIGFAITAVLGEEATKTLDDFTDALRRSTRLTPVVGWLKSFPSSPQRRAQSLAVLAGIGIAILPGILLDFAVRFLLRSPAEFCARHAVPKQGEHLPDPDMEGLANAEAGESEKRPHRHISFRAIFRRLSFALLKFALLLLPLAVFGIAEQLFLSSGLIAARVAHLAVVGISNGYLSARVTYEILLLLFSPGAASLRLIQISTPYAIWIMHRALVLIATIFACFCIISVSEILGLPKDGAGAVIRLAALIVHVEVAVCIWQSRRVVSHWITGRPGTKGFIAGLRQRFAKVWYIFALFYVMSVWVAWAGGIHNALGTLLWAILVVILALMIGRLAWTGSDRLLVRIFPDQTKKSGFAATTFFTRARAYNPLIRLLIRILIAILVVLLMLQGWGVNAFSWLWSNTVSRLLLSALGSILITVAIAIMVWEFANFNIDTRVDKLNAAGRTRHAARLRTLTPMLRAAIGAVIILVTLIICLSRIGVNTTGLLAVSSVVGIAIGFGSQKLVQDIITGLFLLFEDAVQVGDVVSLAGMSGTVERLSIRTIRLRGGDGSINIIPFSSVSTVTNQTRDFSYAQISIMIGYHEDIDRATAVLKDIGAKMRAEPAWGAMMREDLQLFGLDSFGELGLVITGQIRTGPGQHWSVRREFYGRVQRRFNEEGIELPYRNQSLRLDLPPGAPPEQLELGPNHKPAAPEPKG